MERFACLFPQRNVESELRGFAEEETRYAGHGKGRTSPGGDMLLPSVGLRPHLHLQFIQWYRCDSGERSFCVTVLKVAEDFGLPVGVGGGDSCRQAAAPMQVPTKTWSAGGMHLCMYVFR